MSSVAGAIILLCIPVVLLVVELAISPCVTGGVAQTIMAIATYCLMMLWQARSTPFVFKSVTCIIVALFVWAMAQPRILCACHINLWIVLLEHLRDICQLAKTDFKWAQDSWRDVTKGYSDAGQ
jgi:hypothetical protein